MSRVGKFLVYFACIASFICLGFSISVLRNGSYLEVYVCDVGQGDGILVQLGSMQMVIDGGKDNLKMIKCLGKHMPFWDREIEIIVATHPDADHIGGLHNVLSRYTVGTILTNPVSKDSKEFESFKTAVIDEVLQGASLKQPFFGQKISFTRVKNCQFTLFGCKMDNLDCSVMSPRESKGLFGVEKHQNTETRLSDEYSFFLENNTEIIDYNSLSIALFCTYGNTSIFLSGDLEKQGELALLSDQVMKPINALKIGHHGSKTSTSREFLTVARPEIGLISVGENNSYGHPSAETLQSLIDFDVEIRRTDKEGTLMLLSDGERMWMKK